MPGLTKEQILAVNDRKISKVLVPEWGEDSFVYVTSIKASQREEIMKLAQMDQKELFFEIMILTLCDENGVSLGFTREDVAALEEKNLLATTRVFIEALKIVGLNKDALEVAKGN